MFLFFESIRIENGKVMNLEYHQERVSRSSNILLSDVLKTVELPMDGGYKLRISYNSTEYGDVVIAPYLPKSIWSLRVIHTEYFNYREKRNDRSAIDALSLQREGADDVLIVNNGFVCDTSFCNILFSDGKSWFTPTSYLLRGTCRERLIKEGIVSEIEIKLSDISCYKSFMLVNAMLDFDESRAVPCSNIYL